jgi:uncharacterized protein (TIGR02145 family)
MKTLIYSFISLLLLASVKLFAQGNITIHSGAQLTVNGNLEIIPVWTCGSPVTDIRDGRSYNTVQIGTQCWMKQNLNIGTKIAGASNQTNNSIIEKYCYNDDENNCNTYGGLYQWDEAMQYSAIEGAQGICPSGWHLPTDAEWCTMTQYLDPTVNCGITGWSGTNAGGKMKETGVAHWASPNTGATNSSGFTALPGGNRNNNGTFSDLAGTAQFLSSSQVGSSGEWGRYLNSLSGSVYRYTGIKTYGYSVRCIKD